MPSIKLNNAQQAAALQLLQTLCAYPESSLSQGFQKLAHSLPTDGQADIQQLEQLTAFFQAQGVDMEDFAGAAESLYESPGAWAGFADHCVYTLFTGNAGSSSPDAGQVVFDRASGSNSAGTDSYAITYNAPDGSATPLYFTQGKLVSALAQENPAIDLQTAYAPNEMTDEASSVLPVLIGNVNGQQAVGVNLEEQNSTNSLGYHSFNDYFNKNIKRIIEIILIGSGVLTAIMIVGYFVFEYIYKDEEEENEESERKESETDPKEVKPERKETPEDLDLEQDFIKEQRKFKPKSNKPKHQTPELNLDRVIFNQDKIEQLKNKLLDSLNTNLDKKGINRDIEKLSSLDLNDDATIQKTIQDIEGRMNYREDYNANDKPVTRPIQPNEPPVGKPEIPEWKKVPKEDLIEVIKDTAKYQPREMIGNTTLTFVNKYFREPTEIGSDKLGKFKRVECSEFQQAISPYVDNQIEMNSLIKDLQKEIKYDKKQNLNRELSHIKEDIAKLEKLSPLDPSAKKIIEAIKQNQSKRIEPRLDEEFEQFVQQVDTVEVKVMREAWEAEQKKLLDQKNQIKELQQMSNSPETRELLLENETNYRELLSLNPTNPESCGAGLVKVQSNYESTNVSVQTLQQQYGIAIESQPQSINQLNKLKAEELKEKEKDEHPVDEKHELPMEHFVE